MLVNFSYQEMCFDQLDFLIKHQVMRIIFVAIIITNILKSLMYMSHI